MLGKVLGLDLGDKTLGIAISDVMGIISSAVETFRFEEKDLNAKQLSEKLGIPRTTISSWKTRKKKVSIDKFRNDFLIHFYETN